MILLSLFLGAAIALNSDENPKVYPGAMYFPPSRPIYEKPPLALGDWSPYNDENKNDEETKNVNGTNKYVDETKHIDETEYINETKYIDESKHGYPIDLREQSNVGFPSVNHFLPTRPLVDPAITLGEWYPNDDDKKSYFFPNGLYEQMLDSIRVKRVAAGALRIHTNKALPIHADVKPLRRSQPVRVSKPGETAVTVTEKVTAPEDTIYKVKSFRRSLLPLPSKLEIVRRINRIITIVVLFAYVIVEVSPVLHILFNWLGP